MTMQIAARVDARGLACPMPIVRTALQLKQMQPGELLEVLATDPGATKDFVAWAATTGHTLVEQHAEDGVFRFLVRHK
jgi:tRNA 2-thiouridine synthesizing protein A